MVRAPREARQTAKKPRATEGRSDDRRILAGRSLGLLLAALARNTARQTFRTQATG